MTLARFKRAWSVLVATVVVALLSLPAHAQLVTYDGTNSVSFAPDTFVSPIIVGILAAITAAAAIATIFLGVRWIIKAVKLLRG